jgi:hypothetical protein
MSTKKKTIDYYQDYYQILVRPGELEDRELFESEEELLACVDDYDEVVVYKVTYHKTFRRVCKFEEV